MTSDINRASADVPRAGTSSTSPPGVAHDVVRTAGTGARAAGPPRRGGAPRRRTARRTAPSSPPPRCDRARTSTTRTRAPSRSRSSASSNGRRPREPIPSAPQMTGKRSPIFVASVFAGLSAVGTSGPISARRVRNLGDRLVTSAASGGRIPIALERSERCEPEMSERCARLEAGRDADRGDARCRRPRRRSFRPTSPPGRDTLARRPRGTPRASPRCSPSTRSTPRACASRNAPAGPASD